MKFSSFACFDALKDGGGADTLHSAMNRFAVVMALYPEVQAKAQYEINRVVGADRLPESQECVVCRFSCDNRP